MSANHEIVRKTNEIVRETNEIVPQTPTRSSARPTDRPRDQRKSSARPTRSSPRPKILAARPRRSSARPPRSSARPTRSSQTAEESSAETAKIVRETTEILAETTHNRPQDHADRPRDHADRPWRPRKSSATTQIVRDAAQPSPRPRSLSRDHAPLAETTRNPSLGGGTDEPRSRIVRVHVDRLTALPLNLQCAPARPRRLDPAASQPPACSGADHRGRRTGTRAPAQWQSRPDSATLPRRGARSAR